MLFTGPSGAGKTKGMFEIAERALRLGKRVFYMAFDDGYMRHLSKVEKYLIHHNDSELTSSDTLGTFHLWNCYDWPSTRRAYDESKVLWQRKDWIMLDRADMAWDFIQEYTGALREQVMPEDLDKLYYERKLAKLAGTTKEESERLKSNPGGEQDIPWDVVKGAFKGVLYDVTCGPDSVSLRMNVIVSELAQMGIRRFSKSETTEQKNDPRRLYAFNMVIQGEKNVPSWTEATVIFQEENGVYTISTSKDRERKLIANVPVDPEVGFWDTYCSAAVGEELSV